MTRKQGSAVTYPDALHGQYTRNMGLILLSEPAAAVSEDSTEEKRRGERSTRIPCR